MGIYVNLSRLPQSESGYPQQAFVDARGQFAFSHLIPGEYEVWLGVNRFESGKPEDNAISNLILNTRQKVSFGGDGSGGGTGDAAVTLVIDLSQKEGN